MNNLTAADGTVSQGRGSCLERGGVFGVTGRVDAHTSGRAAGERSVQRDQPWCASLPRCVLWPRMSALDDTHVGETHVVSHGYATTGNIVYQ